MYLISNKTWKYLWLRNGGNWCAKATVTPFESVRSLLYTSPLNKPKLKTHICKWTVKILFWMLKKMVCYFSCTDLFLFEAAPLGIITVYHPSSSIHPWQTQDKTHLSIIKSLQILHMSRFCRDSGLWSKLICVWGCYFGSLHPSSRRTGHGRVPGEMGFPPQKSEGFGHISRCWNITFSI